MSNVKISVITVNLNNRAGLERTIASVRSQSLPAEFIVVDGGSTDGSTDLIKQASPDKWVSEKDKGIYDAMNKGIDLSTGDYLLFLNSGDTFFSKEVIAGFSKAATGRKIIYGNSEIIDKGKRSLLVPPSSPDLNFWYRKTLNHQAVFMQRNVFSEYGKFNTAYRICADFALLLKVFAKEPATFQHINETVCIYDQSGFSAAPANYDAMLAEREEILKRTLSEGELKSMKNNYRSALPFKQRMLLFIYDRPFLKKIFTSVYGKGKA